MTATSNIVRESQELGTLIPRPTRTQLAIKARDIIDVLLEDLTSRSGLQNAWDEIDEDVQCEIVDVWSRLIVEELQK